MCGSKPNKNNKKFHFASQNQLFVVLEPIGSFVLQEPIGGLIFQWPIGSLIPHKPIESNQSTAMTLNKWRNATSFCNMISVYLKYSICKCLPPFKNRQVSQLVAYIVSKKEGIVRQSVCLSLFLNNLIYVVCSEAHIRRGLGPRLCMSDLEKWGSGVKLEEWGAQQTADGRHWLKTFF